MPDLNTKMCLCVGAYLTFCSLHYRIPKITKNKDIKTDRYSEWNAKEACKSWNYHNVCQLEFHQGWPCVERVNCWQIRMSMRECTSFFYSLETSWLACFNPTGFFFSKQRTIRHMITKWNTRMKLIDTQQPKKQMAFPSKELVAVCRSCAVPTKHIHHFEAKEKTCSRGPLLKKSPSYWGRCGFFQGTAYLRVSKSVILASCTLRGDSFLNLRSRKCVFKSLSFCCS